MYLKDGWLTFVLLVIFGGMLTVFGNRWAAGRFEARIIPSAERTRYGGLRPVGLFMLGLVLLFIVQVLWKLRH